MTYRYVYLLRSSGQNRNYGSKKFTNSHFNFLCPQQFHDLFFILIFGAQFFLWSQLEVIKPVFTFGIFKTDLAPFLQTHRQKALGAIEKCPQCGNTQGRQNDIFLGKPKVFFDAIQNEKNPICKSN